MKALIVDDDRTVADLLAFTLRRVGFESYLAHDIPAALRSLNNETVDIIVLDVNLPGQPGIRDGFDLCKHIRRTSDVPIILLTVRDEEEDILRGLNLGADDYILKPFSPRQLVARIQTILRRSKSGESRYSEPFIFDDITFDPSRREFTRDGQPPQMLTQLETQLLEYLMLNAGQILPAENIITHVWGAEGGSAEMLRQLVRRLRTKVERVPKAPELIQNILGVGYGFAIKQ